MRRVALVLVFALAALTAGAQSPPTGPAVKPAGIVKLAIAGATPPSGAKQVTSIGEGALAVKTANKATDTDPSWVAKADIDGDGNADETTLLWDDDDKVLFAYAEAGYPCRNGTTGQGPLLVAVNAPFNARKRPAGSGFWVAVLEKGMCNGAADGQLWGCKFDATGANTKCGTATIDAANDALVIASPE